MTDTEIKNLKIGDLFWIDMELREHLYHPGHEHYGKIDRCLFIVTDTPRRKDSYWAVGARLLASQYMKIHESVLQWDVCLNSVYGGTNLMPPKDIVLFIGCNTSQEYQQLLKEILKCPQLENSTLMT